MPLDAKSRTRLAAAHSLLQKLFNACAADPACPPFTILESQRGRAAQERAFALGNSRAHFGQSAHNFSPAVALDVVPFAAGKAINWSDIPRFTSFGKFVVAKARSMGLQITWGATFKKLKDYPHFEIDGWETLVSTKRVKLFNG